MYNKLLWFSVFIIVVMGADFLSTQYALNHGSHEGNPIMASIVNSTFAFLFVKIIGTVAIIVSMAWCLKKNEKIAQTGMKIIGIMMLFVVGNNLFIISVNAVQFNSPTGTVGSIANGNGFYNNDLAIFNISTARNIYTLAEPTAITIVEPISYALKSSGVTCVLIQKGNSNIKYGMVASDGYLYYVDTDGVKQKISRDVAGCSGNIFANNTEIGGTSLLIYASSNIFTLQEYGGYIYFLDGTTLKRFLTSSLVPETVATISNSQNNQFILIHNSTGIYFITSKATQHVTTFYITTFSGVTTTLLQKTDGYGGSEYTWTEYIDGFYTPNYIGILDTHSAGSGSGTWEGTININNGTVHSGFVWNTPIYRSDYSDCFGVCYALGGYSTYGLYSSTTNTYNVFNFIEPGFLNVATTPSLATYSLQTISSLYPTYYNNSKIQLLFSVAYTATANQTTSIHHRIDLFNPSNVVVGTFIPITVCEEVGYWDWLLYPNKLYNCIAVSKLIDINDFIANPTAALAGATQISFSPTTTWDNGTYTAKLYETPTNALLASTTLTILNQSGTTTVGAGSNPGQNPNEPIDGSGIVTLLQNNTFWAFLLTIGVMLAVGIPASKNGGSPIMPMAMAGFLGLGVTTMIGWMPIWTTGGVILVVIVSFAWQQATKTNTGGQ